MLEDEIAVAEFSKLPMVDRERKVRHAYEEVLAELLNAGRLVPEGNRQLNVVYLIGGGACAKPGDILVTDGAARLRRTP